MHDNVKPIPNRARIVVCAAAIASVSLLWVLHTWAATSAVHNWQGPVVPQVKPEAKPYPVMAPQAPSVPVPASEPKAIEVPPTEGPKVPSKSVWHHYYSRQGGEYRYERPGRGPLSVRYVGLIDGQRLVTLLTDDPLLAHFLLCVDPCSKVEQRDIVDGHVAKTTKLKVGGDQTLLARVLDDVVHNRLEPYGSPTPKS